MSSTPQPQEEPTSAEVPKTLIVLQVVLLLAIAYLVFALVQSERSREAAIKAKRLTQQAMTQKVDAQVQAKMKRYLKGRQSFINRTCSRYFKKYFESCYQRRWKVHPPCGAKDTNYEVVSVAGLGRFCLEKQTRDLIKQKLKKNEKWESEMIDYFKKYIRKGTQVLDIGAHIGTHTLLLSRFVGPKGSVHAFEPQSKIYQELLINLNLNKANNVYAHFAALGATHTRVAMSLPKMNNEGATEIGAGSNRVELRTLDSFKITNVSLMKIDVEGFEFAVLQGAKRTIAREKPTLLIEMWANDAKSRAQKRKTIALLKSYGYKTFTLIPKSKHNYLVTF